MLRSLWYWFIGSGTITLILLDVYVRSFVQSSQALDARLKRKLAEMFHLLDSPIVIKGTPPDMQQGPYIFMANHLSLLDIPLLQVVIPGHFRGILSDHQFSWPLYGAVLKRLGHIPIPRTHFRGSLETYRNTARLIREERIHITVLPEGNRSLTGHLLRFKTLPFQFAMEAGVPIIPLYINGTYAMKNKHSWRLQPTSLEITFGNPIQPADTEPRFLRDEVRAWFLNQESEHEIA